MLSDFLLFNSGNRNTLEQVSKLQHELDIGTEGSSAPNPSQPPAPGTLQHPPETFILYFIIYLLIPSPPTISFFLIHWLAQPLSLTSAEC